MISGLTKLLEHLLGGEESKRREDSMDKVQLDAAQDRLQHRSIQLDESVDQLGKMIRRMKRKQQGGRRT